jgi:hypothetical protein
MPCARQGIIATLALLALATAAPAAAAAAGEAGAVKFVKRTDSSFDRFTAVPTPTFVSWMNQHFWRAEVFSPYFDTKTSWYPRGWAYRDLYALYTGSSYATLHRDWILRDGAGNLLYIPWGCSGGSCPQYAADIGNAAFRQAWIASARAEVSHGYAGLWIDDVNLDFRVGDGAGRPITPIDPRTGAPMSEHAWREYMDTFLEEIRRALPGVELLHNSIWFAGGPERDTNPNVKREIAAADYINLERGVNDSGLTGGSGQWSLQSLFSFIDRVHAAGKGVVLDGGDSSASGREYSLASYFLISTGSDGVGLGSMTPENWWPGFDQDLGAAQGARTIWQGLMRRDFQYGLALVNEPQAATRTVALPAPMYTTSGAVVTSVTLGAAQGAVLRYVTPPGLSAAPANSATSGRSAGKAGPGSSTRHSRHRSLSLHVRRRTRGSHPALLISGHVSRAHAGRVRLYLARRVRGSYVVTRELIARVRGARFRASVRVPRPGRYRVSAAYVPSGSAHAAAYRSLGLRIAR